MSTQVNGQNSTNANEIKQIVLDNVQTSTSTSVEVEHTHTQPPPASEPAKHYVENGKNVGSVPEIEQKSVDIQKLENGAKTEIANHNEDEESTGEYVQIKPKGLRVVTNAPEMTSPEIQNLQNIHADSTKLDSTRQVSNNEKSSIIPASTESCNLNFDCAKGEVKSSIPEAPPPPPVKLQVTENIEKVKVSTNGAAAADGETAEEPEKEDPNKPLSLGEITALNETKQVIGMVPEVQSEKFQQVPVTIQSPPSGPPPIVTTTNFLPPVPKVMTPPPVEKPVEKGSISFDTVQGGAKKLTPLQNLVEQHLHAECVAEIEDWHALKADFKAPTPETSHLTRRDVQWHTTAPAPAPDSGGHHTQTGAPVQQAAVHADTFDGAGAGGSQVPVPPRAQLTGEAHSMSDVKWPWKHVDAPSFALLTQDDQYISRPQMPLPQQMPQTQGNIGNMAENNRMHSSMYSEREIRQEQPARRIPGYRSVRLDLSDLGSMPTFTAPIDQPQQHLPATKLDAMLAAGPQLIHHHTEVATAPPVAPSVAPPVEPAVAPPVQAPMAPPPVATSGSGSVILTSSVIRQNEPENVPDVQGKVDVQQGATVGGAVNRQTSKAPRRPPPIHSQAARQHRQMGGAMGMGGPPVGGRDQIRERSEPPMMTGSALGIFGLGVPTDQQQTAPETPQMPENPQPAAQQTAHVVTANQHSQLPQPNVNSQSTHSEFTRRQVQRANVTTGQQAYRGPPQAQQIPHQHSPSGISPSWRQGFDDASATPMAPAPMQTPMQSEQVVWRVAPAPVQMAPAFNRGDVVTMGPSTVGRSGNRVLRSRSGHFAGESYSRNMQYAYEELRQSNGAQFMSGFQYQGQHGSDDFL